MVVVTAAFVVALVATPPAGWVATRLGLFDHPGPFKVQSRPVPYLGGAAVTLAFGLGLGLTEPVLLAPVLLAFAVGLADDVSPLSPTLRLVAAAAIGALVAGVVETPDPEWLRAVIPLAVVVLVNGVNMVDGLDGLAAGTGLVGALAFAAALGGDGRDVALVLAAALAGFLAHNLPPARIYLGDAGSYVIGVGLAVLLAWSWGPAEPAPARVASLVFVAYPAAEVAFSVVRRWRAGAPLFGSDRGHVYDRLVQRGWSAPAAVAACVGGQAALAAAALGASALGAA